MAYAPDGTKGDDDDDYFLGSAYERVTHFLYYSLPKVWGSGYERTGYRTSIYGTQIGKDVISI